jgi:putative phosphonate metabolism protein
MKRFAVYFAPAEDSPLWRQASVWLGRDPFTGATLPTPPLNGIAQEVWRAATAEPRRYGFHATLKPPFRLAAGATEEELRAAIGRVAQLHRAFEVPPLKVGLLAGFLALILSDRSLALEELAAACVRDLDALRAPPMPEELARRRHSNLTPEQTALLERWGYPYVLDEWRFHMTLTSCLEPSLLKPIAAHLEGLFEPYCLGPLRIDSICLFEQPKKDEPFRVVERYSLP